MVTEPTVESRQADVAEQHPVVLNRRPWTVQEYHAMAEAGILGEKDRVELIDGIIVDMSPVGPAHIQCVYRLNRWLSRLLIEHGDDRLFVSVQSPVRLSEHHEPEPDLIIIREVEGAPRVPKPEDILLLVEVADSSLAYDREVKLPLYAAAGIPEVWIVALPEQQVAVYRDPSPKGYKQAQFLSEGDTVAVEALADAGTIAIDELFR